jgi:hypothetical protein
MGMEVRQGVERRGGVRAALIAAIGCALLSAPAGAGAEPVLDAHCDGPSDGSSLFANGDEREAQTFTALHSGGLTRATIEINNALNLEGSDIVLSILPTGNGVPLDPPLASVAIPTTSVPSGVSTLDAAFPAPATAVAGQEYAVAIGRAGTLPLNFAVQTRAGNPCGGAPFFNTGPGWSPESPGDFDVVFQTFVDPQVIGAQGPAPGQLAFGPGRGGSGSASFTLVEKKGLLFAKVSGPGKLVVDDAKKPKRRSIARQGGFLKRTKAKAKKAGLVRLRVELTDCAIRRAFARQKLNTVGGVTYTPRGGTPSTITFPIRVRL